MKIHVTHCHIGRSQVSCFVLLHGYCSFFHSNTNLSQSQLIRPNLTSVTRGQKPVQISTNTRGYIISLSSWSFVPVQLLRPLHLFLPVSSVPRTFGHIRQAILDTSAKVSHTVAHGTGSAASHAVEGLAEATGCSA